LATPFWETGVDMVSQLYQRCHLCWLLQLTVVRTAPTAILS
jgi:hypothetical protein